MDALVVGAGLAGLTAAHTLAAAGLSVVVVEARPRVGGRLLTVPPDGAGGEGWLDLGATWLWADQPRVRALADELGIASFPQFRDGSAMVEEASGRPPARLDVPPPEPAELRLVGGAQQLCERLAARLAPDSVTLSTSVTAVADDGVHLAVTVDDPDAGPEVAAGYVVLAVPPRLALERITFSPPLPDQVARVLKLTPTWMGNAVKCLAVYDSAFWRDAGLSGFATSQAGPLTEVHDASTDDGSLAALFGFVSPRDDYRVMGPAERAELVFAQLARLFGAEAADPAQYFERDWAGDPNTNDEQGWWLDGEPLSYGHPAFGQPLLGGRLFWAGAETADDGGGHMEGAVRSGRRAAAMILEAAS